MPLRISRRPDTGTLWITGTVRAAGQQTGRRVRQRAGSDDERLAREEAATLEANILKTAWHGERPSSHNFAEAVAAYLRSAARSKGTKGYARRLLVHFKEEPLGSLDQEAWDRARAGLLRDGASPSTEARILGVLLAILHHAAKRRWITMPTIEKPAEPKGRTRFFLPAQAEALIAEGRHCQALFRFLFCTGCRVSEALGLEWDAVDLSAARVILWEGETKSGARRIVTLSPAAIVALAGLVHREGRVFLDRAGRPYRTEGGYGGQIRKTWDGAVERAKAPALSPHHARHSWASWHYAVHRDLLALKAEGGWSTVLLVERYAHIVPIGHENEIRRVWGVVPGRASRRA